MRHLPALATSVGKRAPQKPPSFGPKIKPKARPAPVVLCRHTGHRAAHHFSPCRALAPRSLAGAQSRKSTGAASVSCAHRVVDLACEFGRNPNRSKPAAAKRVALVRPHAHPKACRAVKQTIPSPGAACRSLGAIQINSSRPASLGPPRWRGARLANAKANENEARRVGRLAAGGESGNIRARESRPELKSVAADVLIH